jgi:hypothetical protein
LKEEDNLTNLVVDGKIHIKYDGPDREYEGLCYKNVEVE